MHVFCVKTRDEKRTRSAICVRIPFIIAFLWTQLSMGCHAYRNALFVIERSENHTVLMKAYYLLRFVVLRGQKRIRFALPCLLTVSYHPFICIWRFKTSAPGILGLFKRIAFLIILLPYRALRSSTTKSTFSFFVIPAASENISIC